MLLTDIIFRILKNGSSYPGKHNYSTERTSPSSKPLEPKSQVKPSIFWLSLTVYVIDDHYLEGTDWVFKQ